MPHRLHTYLCMFTLPFLLGACAPKDSIPGTWAATTLEEGTLTPTGLPPTPTSVSPSPAVTSSPPTLSYEETLPLFHYEPSAPFDVEIVSEQVQAGAIVQDLTYQAADSQFTQQAGGRIDAYLVKPAGNGPFAGVLFMHGLGAGWGNRREFLDEAVGLASQGVVSVLPAGQFPWLVSFTGVPETDHMNVINQVVELRRSVDFLLAQAGVDPQRIAFVGHDYGAMHGAVLAGVEKRIKAYVLMAGDSNYSDWAFQYFTEPADRDAYRRFMAAVDPVSYLPHATPAAIFFQFGGRDRFINQETSNQQVDAASQPKKLGWYADAGHTLNAQASRERVDWLTEELDLKPLP